MPDESDWEEDNGMVERQPEIVKVADPANQEVYKFIDYASAIRVNQRFKKISFTRISKSK